MQQKNTPHILIIGAGAAGLTAGNRLVGYLHGCLQHQSTYNEHTAWSHRTQPDQLAA